MRANLPIKRKESFAEVKICCKTETSISCLAKFILKNNVLAKISFAYVKNIRTKKDKFHGNLSFFLNDVSYSKPLAVI